MVEEAKEQVLFVGFNQDQSCISIGTTSGFRIYQTDPVTLLLTRELHGGIGIVELLYQQHIMALVGGGDNPKWSRNKVIMWNDEEV